MRNRADNFSDVCTETDMCAITGAIAFCAGVPDALTVVNGPLWCFFYSLRHLERNLPLLSERLVCTQLDNNSIVFGSEEYLLETIKPYVDKQPKLLFAVNNCSAGLIGDDVAGIVRSAGISSPVIFFDSGGIAGAFTEGYVKAADKLLDILPLDLAATKIKNSVNLLGMTVGYYNASNDCKELVRLLTLAGYTVNAMPGMGTSYDELKNLNSAELNIVVNEELGLSLAKRLSDEYDMPFVNLLPPYGIEGTKRWLSAINEKLPAPNRKEAFAECERVKKKILLSLNDFKMLWSELRFKDTIVAAPSSSAFAIAEAFRTEWADTERLSIIVQKAVQNKIDCADEIFFTDKDAEKIENRLRNFKGGLIIGSSNEAAILRDEAKGDLQTLAVAMPVMERISLSDEPFMGIRGACFLQENLWNDYIKYRLWKKKHSN